MIVSARSRRNPAAWFQDCAAWCPQVAVRDSQPEQREAALGRANGELSLLFEKQSKKFSDFVDKQTGYKTKCMLTYPMVAEKECIGVVMALNKIGAPAFTAEDEQVKMHGFTPSLGNDVPLFFLYHVSVKTLTC